MTMTDRPMRPLTERQAKTCENALRPTCKCRCGGEFHGGKRGGENVPDRGFFETLPQSDPHYLPDAEERARRKKASQQRAYQKRKQARAEEAMLWLDEQLAPAREAVSKLFQ